MALLYIPTSGDAFKQTLLNESVAKGVLYNLDTDEYIGFQFNPTSFEWKRESHWSRTTWNGNTSGGDLTYIGIGPRKIELPLLFITDPGAPYIEHGTNDKLSTPDMRFDFQALRAIIERWESKLEELGRASRIRIINGPNYFDGVIISSSFRVTDQFSDLSVQEATMTLEFEEWQSPLPSTQL